MAVSYYDGITQAKVFLREDQNRLKPNDWILIGEQARQHFSKDRPRLIIADIAGTGTRNYTLTGTVTSWVNRFSSIRSVEYPSAKEPPNFLQSDDYMLYKSATDTEILKFIDDIPSAPNSIRLTFTSRHGFDPTQSTIDDDDKMLIALLLGSYAAQALVSDFLKPNRSNLPNDSIDFDLKAKSMSDLADDLMKMYAQLLSGKSADVPSYFTLYKDYDMLGRFGDEFILNPEDDR